jgi:hypothetical protein
MLKRKNWKLFRNNLKKMEALARGGEGGGVNLEPLIYTLAA